MKYIFYISFFLIGIVAKAQLPSNTFISRNFTGNTKAQWILLDSPLVNFVGASLFNARYAGTQFVKIGSGDTAFYFGAGGNLWFRSLLDRDTVSLSNRINLKLNITDTTNKWWNIGKRWVDTVYRVNDSTIGFTINNGAQQTFEIKGGASGGGGGSGTVTSVALSMPSAFSVSGSPITSSGTFSVSGAGTSAQYIRGNGTLATFDTTAIPNFYLKARGLLSGTSPITYNTTTGAIGINNASTSGTKGAATFTSAFSDNGLGTIDLANVTSAGTCINCDITFDAKGRAISYASGTPPQFVNAPGAGDTLSISDTLKRLNNGYGILHVVTANNITHSVDTSSANSLVTQYDLGQIDRLGAKVFYLSKNGGIPDADVSMHSTSLGTDNTAVIKAILDQATSLQPIILIVDGGYSADSIRVKSNTTIDIIEGGGLIQRDGINTSFIANYNRTAGVIIDSNITIKGGIINGHGHDADGSENRSYRGQKGWNTVFNFRGIKNLKISNVDILNSRTFLSFISNCENVIIENCDGFQSPSIPTIGGVTFSLIHDAFKFNGPCDFVVFKNNSSYNVDDAVSICSNDGFFPTDSLCFGLNLLDSFVSYGDIDNFLVDGFQFRNGYHGFRVLTTADTIKNLIFTNISGITHENLCIIDNFPSCVYNHGASYVEGYVESLLFNNIDPVIIPNIIDNSTGNAGIYISTFINEIKINNVNYSGYQSGYPFFRLNTGKTINTLNSTGVKINELQPPQDAYTLTGTITNLRGDVFDIHENDITILDSYNLILKKNGTERNMMLKNDATVNSVPNLSVYPANGTNDASDFSIVPRGTGLGTFKSQLSFFGTDYVVDKTNYELLAVRATGADGYGFVSLSAGSGSRRDIWFDMSGALSASAAALTLKTNGQIGINNPSPTHKLDIINTGSGGSTGWGIQITGSASSGPGIVLKNNNDSKKWLITNGISSATDGVFAIYDIENSAQRITISGSTGAVTFNNSINTYTFPSVRASAGQVLTDVSGTGALSWQTPSSITTLYTGDGTLPTDRIVTANTNTLTVTGSAAFADGAQFDVITSGSVGIAIRGQSTDGRGVMGLATTGVGIYGSATGVSGYGLFGISSGTGGNAIYGSSTSGMILEGVMTPTSTNTVIPSLSLTRSSQSAGANGIGQSIDFYLHTSTSDQLSNQIVSTLTDAINATRTSQLEIYGVNNATSGRKAALAGTGQWTWDGYGVGTFTGTPTSIIMSNSSGGIIEGTTGNLLELQSGNIQFNDAYLTPHPNNQIFMKGRMVRQSYDVPDANFTTLLTRQEGLFELSDITANRTFSMYSGSGVDGDEFYIFNGNTSVTFSWSFAGVTPQKASDGSSVTTLTNGVMYHIMGIYDGSTARWIIVNQ